MKNTGTLFPKKAHKKYTLQQMEQKSISKKAWRREKTTNSLPEVFSSINVPENAGFWKTLLAFSGPGLMVAVGYMDPGNWATDIAGGAQFGYTLLSVILISNFFAIISATPFFKVRCSCRKRPCTGLP